MKTNRKLDVGRKIIIKWILKKEDRVVWTGLIWLKIGASRELL
jgi:hypothetical protein